MESRPVGRPESDEHTRRAGRSPPARRVAGHAARHVQRADDPTRRVQRPFIETLSDGVPRTVPAVATMPVSGGLPDSKHMAATSKHVP